MFKQNNNNKKAQFQSHGYGVVKEFYENVIYAN